ncbi:MAG TPA: A/G-specific adenine glycosylase [Candidatus Micrarchaeia archaeon]|nr:A/G-specific adenine glycosylase [Candidatus Micrarchaeia archaeon]
MACTERAGAVGAVSRRPVRLVAQLPAHRRRRIVALVLAWYRVHQRTLPWRRTKDPWAVLVSEILLHQTQVARAVPVYQGFIERWPDPPSCAAAPLAEIKALTDPLGYHARGGWLHGIAAAVSERPPPHLPVTAPELRRFRGIGRYTAAAVASIAFGAPEPLVDTNVVRLFERLFRLPPDRRRAGSPRLWAVAERLVPRTAAGDFNQGLMELGALICRPRAPRCGVCPLEPVCASRHRRLTTVRFREGSARPRAAPDRGRQAE